MTMLRKPYLLTTVILLMFLRITAQDQLVLSLEGARQHALQHNLTLKNSGLAISHSGERIREAIAAGLPQLNSTMDYSNALGASISIRFNPDAPATEIPIRPTSNMSLQLSQLLFNANYFVGIEMARIGRDLIEKSYVRTEQEILASVTDSYYLVLVSEDLLTLLSKNLANLEEIHRKTAALEAVGIIESTDVDQLFVQIASLRNSVRSSERQLEMANNMLRLVLGASAETQLELTENMNALLTGVVVESSVSPIPFQLQQNLDFQLMDFQEKLSEQQVRMQRANYLPTLSGFYNRTEKILKPDFDTSPQNMLGLRLSIPIFSSGQRNAQVKQALIDLETTRNNKALLADQLRIQEKQLQFNLRTALETYTNQLSNLDVSRRVYNNLKLKFEHGLISGLDLVNADNNYVRAETDYISAVFQLLRANVELEKLYGQIN